MILRPGLVLTLFLRDARIHRKRALLTAMAIAWGTVSIVLMLSFGEGFRHQLATGLSSMGSDLVVAWPGKTTKPFNGIPEGRPLRIRMEDVEWILARSPHIRAGSAEMVNWSGSLTAGETTVSARVSAVHPAYGALRNQEAEQGGRFINEADHRERRRVIFLGHKLKTKLFGDGGAIGRTVLLDRMPYTVIGVLRERLQSMMYLGPDSGAAVVPVSTWAAQSSTAVVENFLIRPVSRETGAAAIRDVYALLASRYRFDPKDEAVIMMFDPEKVMASVHQGISILEIMLGILGAITLAVGGIGVANIMSAAVRQRTKEIGVQMAVGARPSWIMGSLIIEAVAQTLAGGAAGVAISLAIMAAVRRLPIGENEAVEFLRYPVFSPMIALVTTLILGAIGLFSGLVPARRAVRIDPAEVLRYE